MNLDQAIAGIEATAPSSAPAAPTADSAPATSRTDGTWTVDRTITNAQSTGSFAGFRIDEVLVSVGSTTAVGRTPSVDGTVTVSGSTVSAAQITADPTDVTTNDPGRDDAVQRALATTRFPDATFVLTQPITLASTPADGERITVPRPATSPSAAQRRGSPSTSRPRCRATCSSWSDRRSDACVRRQLPCSGQVPPKRWEEHHLMQPSALRRTLVSGAFVVAATPSQVCLHRRIDCVLGSSPFVRDRRAGCSIARPAGRCRSRCVFGRGCTGESRRLSEPVSNGAADVRHRARGPTQGRRSGDCKVAIPRRAVPPAASYWSTPGG